MLVVLSGLPGTGKTTIGKALVAKRSAAYVRVDEIEHALRQHSGFNQEIGAAGYVVAFAIASSNLKLGNLVIADCVNPVPESRQGWRDVVRAVEGARLIEVEIICSDENEHRRRAILDHYLKLTFDHEDSIKSAKKSSVHNQARLGPRDIFVRRD